MKTTENEVHKTVMYCYWNKATEKDVWLCPKRKESLRLTGAQWVCFERITQNHVCAKCSIVVSANYNLSTGQDKTTTEKE